MPAYLHGQHIRNLTVSNLAPLCFVFHLQLAANADIYVNDAFGTAHRAHASTEGVTKFLKPSVAGFLLQKARLLADLLLGVARISMCSCLMISQEPFIGSHDGWSADVLWLIGSFTGCSNSAQHFLHPRLLAFCCSQSLHFALADS
jgi:hypothetical protein